MNYFFNYVLSISPWLISFGISEYVRWEFMKDGGGGNSMGVVLISLFAFLAASLLAAVLSAFSLKTLKTIKNNKPQLINCSVQLLIPLILNIFIIFQCVFKTNFDLSFFIYGLILLVPTLYVIHGFVKILLKEYYA